MTRGVVADGMDADNAMETACGDGCDCALTGGD